MNNENLLRNEWKVGSFVEIYSYSKRKWFLGEIVTIFDDNEGEWLEIRYNKSMSKEVQRYSSDIRPQPQDCPHESLRTKPSKWGKGSHVQIFSNTDQKWYFGEISNITHDHEGEWLNVIYIRQTGEVTKKQVQRYSKEIKRIKKKYKKKYKISLLPAVTESSTLEPAIAEEKEDIKEDKNYCIDDDEIEDNTFHVNINLGSKLIKLDKKFDSNSFVRDIKREIFQQGYGKSIDNVILKYNNNTMLDYQNLGYYNIFDDRNLILCLFSVENGIGQ
mmetsp:Transcript_20673/g.25539  ORF Transcript_20673/g.25539 Transcript_20673/m.25539 type:complete len:274 (-) Transcript_20673:48-869(-)